MAHMKKSASTGHLLKKSTGHLINVCGDPTYTQARRCADDALVDLFMLTTDAVGIAAFSYSGICYYFDGDIDTPGTIIEPADVTEFADCTECGTDSECQCDPPVSTVTITIAGMSGSDATEHNGTYPGVPLYAGTGSLCVWRYNWEEIDPPPATELNMDFSKDNAGNVAIQIGHGIGFSITLFQSGITTPINQGAEFCAGTPIVFTVNEAGDPDWAGTVTVTAD